MKLALPLLSWLLSWQAGEAALKARSKGSKGPNGCCTAIVDPSPEQESWQKQVKEANEVSKLSDRIHEVQVMINRWKHIHAEAKHYHEHQTEMLRTQIDVRERQIETMTKELDAHVEAESSRFKTKMCMMLMRAFHLGGEKDVKIKVLKICHKLRQFEFLQEEQHHHHVHHRAHRKERLSLAKISRSQRLQGQWELRLEHQLRKIVRNLGVVQRRVAMHLESRVEGVDNLKQQLKNMEKTLEDIKTKYSEDKAKWKVEKTALDHAEDELGEQVTLYHHARWNITVEVANKTRDHFCPVVNANYGMDESKITTFVEAECA